MAEAAAHAALLAGEALKLSQLGDDLSAQSKLRQAEQIDGSLKRGEIPDGLTELGGRPLLASPRDRWQALFKQLLSREGLLLIVAAVGTLLVLILLVVLLAS